MGKLTRKKVLLAKIEGTPGTDSNPTGSANAILCRNFDMTPIEGDTVNRELIRGYLGASEEFLVGEYRLFEFEVECAGAGAAGDVPAYGVLLRACGMDETVTADTSVAYKPVSDGFETVTLYGYLDGLLHELTFGMGNAALDFTAKGIPFMRFRFLGTYAPVTDTALPAADFDGFVKPLPVGNTNTPVFSFFDEDLVMESARFDLNNSVDFRSLVGAEYTQISDRQSTGEIVFETVPVATLDVMELARTNQTGVVQLVHGTAAGNIFQIDIPAFDIGKPAYGDSNGVSMTTCPGTLSPVSGNDEITLTIR